MGVVMGMMQAIDERQKSRRTQCISQGKFPLDAT